jgi:hypothetical protein
MTTNSSQGTSGQQEDLSEEVMYDRIIRLLPTKALAELSFSYLKTKRISRGNQSTV